LDATNTGKAQADVTRVISRTDAFFQRTMAAFGRVKAN